MPKTGARCGDGLRPELQALFDRLAVDPRSELFVRHTAWSKPGRIPLPRQHLQTLCLFALTGGSKKKAGPRQSLLR
jgi:hypothetical protein